MGEQVTNQSGAGSSLVDRAHDIAVLAGERAEKAEAARTPDSDVINAVVDAGFARHFVAPRFGGTWGTLAELKRAAVTIGAECPATAWCAGLAALWARAVGFLPPEGQERLWANGPDALVSGGVTPRGTADPVAGGWQLSGSWPLVSGCEHADWVMLAGIVLLDGARADRVFVVPRAAVGIERTWDDIGMQATGSHTVVVDEVFVAESMTFPFRCFTDLDTAQAGPDGRAVPLLGVNTFVFCLPMLGAARGALNQWQRVIGPKLNSPPAHDDAVFARYAEVFARSTGEIDAAELMLDRVAHLIDSADTSTRVDAGRNQRDCAFAAELLVTAVDRLMRISGTSGHSTRLPLQRLWRDIHTAGGHPALQFGTAAAAFAREVVTPSS
ncbi:acyl-CoA dehydrogenase family protein [Nocardia sp. NPDC051463]|uniref:acyl-CoA dehydrogenase family protein n=1 Tax=Nocardia sp. NPDC051463 TaxID=3154845 RepID=UPI00342A1258